MPRCLCALALAALALAGCSGDDGGESAAPVAIQTVAVAPTTLSKQRVEGFEIIPAVVARVEPSVVTIITDVAEGSGVIWSADGVIVTNAHVIEGAKRVAVALATGGRFEAKIVARAPRFDLAVLRIDRDGLPAARFQQALPRVGELALAMGNPLGFEQSVTAGIISGRHRSVPSGGQTPALVDLLQTDAAISPGNSGGALVNADGEVVGINVAYIPPAEGAVALGFAIPGATAVRVVRELLTKGRVEVAALGIVPIQVTPDLAAQFGLGVTFGAAVREVAPGSGAARAGIRPGDVIVSLDGKRIEMVEDLYAELREHRPGDRVTVVVVRDGKRVTLAVTLTDAS